VQWLIRLLQGLVREHAGSVLVAFAALELFAGIAALRLRVDARSVSLLGAGDPELLRSSELERRFGGDGTLLVAFDLGHPFTTDDLRGLARVSDRIREIEGVEEVVDLSTVEDVRLRDGTLDASPFLDRERLAYAQNSGLEALWDRVFGHRLYHRQLVSPALDVFAIRILEAPPDPAQPGRSKRVVEAVQRALAAEALRWPVHVVGPPESERQVDRLLRLDLARQASLALALVVALAALATRRWIALVAVAALVGFSVSILLAWLVLSDTPLTRVTAFSPLILGAPVALAGVHALGLFEGGAGAERPALAWIERICAPVVIAGASLGAGFLSLRSSGAGPVSDLGTALAIGIAAAVAAALLLLPALLDRLRSRELALPAWMQRAGSCGIRFARRPRLTCALAALALAASLPGLLRLRVESDLLDLFHPQSAHVQSAHLVARELYGSRVLNVAIETGRPGGALEPDALELARALIREARSTPLVEGTSSLLDYLWLIDAALRPEESPREIPPSGALAARYLQHYAAGGDIGDLRNLLDADRSGLRLVLRLATLSSAAILDLRERLLFRAGLLAGETRVEVYGEAQLSARAAHEIAAGMARGLGWALAAVGLALALALRSLRLAPLALLSSALPVLLWGSALGWAGIPLSPGTSLGGCIALGLGAAASCQVFARIERGPGLRESYARIGRPLLFSGLALCAGAAPLALSELQTLRSLAAASALALGTSLALGLGVMPSLLVLAGYPLEAAAARGDEA